jgi:hypothetical protein
VWVICNPTLTLQFEERVEARLVVDCWVDLSSLDSSSYTNSLEEIYRHGFQLPKDGMVFRTVCVMSSLCPSLCSVLWFQGEISFPDDGESDGTNLFCSE